jgi:sulfur carrier protein
MQSAVSTNGRPIALTVNGQATTTHVATLAELLDEAGHGDGKVATARNGDFVPARSRALTYLTDGDVIEIVSPRQGG